MVLRVYKFQLFQLHHVINMQTLNGLSRCHNWNISGILAPATEPLNITCCLSTIWFIKDLNKIKSLIVLSVDLKLRLHFSNAWTFVLIYKLLIAIRAFYINSTNKFRGSKFKSYFFFNMFYKVNFVCFDLWYHQNLVNNWD